MIWGQRQEPPLECNDPLLTSFMGLHGLQVFFPEAGKYDLVILANGEEVVRDSIYAHLASEQTT